MRGWDFLKGLWKARRYSMAIASGVVLILLLYVIYPDPFNRGLSLTKTAIRVSALTILKWIGEPTPQQIAEIKQPEIKPPPPSPAVSDSKPKPNKQAKPQPKPEPSKAEPPKPESPGASAQKQETPPGPTINAPFGIAIGGGNVTNPTVNNFAPPDPNFTASVVENPNSPEDDPAKYKMRVIIKTDVVADIPPFELVFDGPYLEAHMSVHGRGSYGSNVIHFKGEHFKGEHNTGAEYPWAQFALGGAGKLRPDGEIHIDVKADQPIKLRQISKP